MINTNNIWVLITYDKILGSTNTFTFEGTKEEATNKSVLFKKKGYQVFVESLEKWIQVNKIK